jgi:hypothetical protein
MFRNQTSAEAGRPAGRRSRRGRRAITVAAALTAVGALGLLGTVPAHASVQPNGFAYYITNLDHTGCNLAIGSQASPVLYGIGEVDIACPVPYNLVIEVQLWHATSLAGANATLLASNYYAHTVASAGVRTLPSVCGYTSASNYWAVRADVSFNNGKTFSGWIYSQYWVKWASGRC